MSRNVFSAPIINGLYIMEKEGVEPQRLVHGVKKGYITEADLEAAKKEYYEKGKKDGIAEAMQKIEDARKIAYEGGYANGRNEATEELMPKYQAMKVIFDQWNAMKDRLLKELELDAAQLSLAIGRKIVGYELRGCVKVLKQVVHEAMKVIRDRKIIRIRVSLEDKESFKLGAREFFSTFGEEVDVVEDPHISQGGCIIETDIGNVDAQMETRWNMITDTIFSGTNRTLNDDISKDLPSKDREDKPANTIHREGEQDNRFVG